MSSQSEAEKLVSDSAKLQLKRGVSLQTVTGEDRENYIAVVEGKRAEYRAHKDNFKIFRSDTRQWRPK